MSWNSVLVMLPVKDNEKKASNHVTRVRKPIELLFKSCPSTVDNKVDVIRTYLKRAMSHSFREGNQNSV